MFGYKGKQVRDNIHSQMSWRFIGRFIASPRCGEVYNLGGGRANSISILEAFKLIESTSAQTDALRICGAEPRQATTSVTSRTLKKMKAHYPGWEITKDLKTTFTEIFQAWTRRTASV